MPALEEKQVTELNKNVQKVVKILETATGNTATIKAKKDEEKKQMKMKEDILGREKELLDEQEQAEKDKKVKLFHIAGFIKTEANNYFSKTEQNMLTWGGLFKSIGTGIRKWFDEVLKQNTMLGRTLRLGSSLWKATHDHIIGTIKNVFGAIGSQVREVLGEVAGVFDFFKGIFMGIFNFIKDSFLGFFKRVPPEDRKRNQYLQQMVGFMRRAEKREFLETGVGKKTRDTSIWMLLAMATAAIIGGLLRKFLLPFEVLLLKPLTFLLKPLQMFHQFMLRFKLFGKLMAPLVGAGGMWDKVISVTAKFSGFISKLPILGKLFGALKFGFKFLGWPIQIIFGVIDFIKGFAQAEGSLANRLIEGGKAAIMGFIELPVKLIGWVIEKLLDLFGIEVDGIAQKILDVISSIFDLFTSFFRPVIGFFEGFFKTKGSFMDKLKGAVMGFFKGLMKIFEIVKPIAKFLGVDIGETETTPEPPKPKSSLSTITESEAKKEAEKQKEQTDQLKNAMKEQTRMQIEANKELAKDQEANVALAIAGQKAGNIPRTAEQQIPDEMDNIATAFMNSMGSF